MLEPHPIAELFPLLQSDQLRTLARDIAENGLQQPVTTDRAGPFGATR